MRRRALLPCIETRIGRFHPLERLSLFLDYLSHAGIWIYGCIDTDIEKN